MFSNCELKGTSAADSPAQRRLFISNNAADFAQLADIYGGGSSSGPGAVAFNGDDVLTLVNYDPDQEVIGSNVTFSGHAIDTFGNYSSQTGDDWTAEAIGWYKRCPDAL